MEPIEKIFQKIANMNQNIEAVVREQNELLDTSLYTKASDCYIKDKNDQRVYVGDTQRQLGMLKVRLPMIVRKWIAWTV